MFSSATIAISSIIVAICQFIETQTSVKILLPVILLLVFSPLLTLLNLSRS